MAEASLLIPVIKGILELSISLAKDPIMDQIKPVWGFKKDLKKLCQRLEIIQSLLEAAENQNLTSKPMLATWLKHLKAATCDAENVLDELAYEDLRRKTEEGNHMGKKVRDLVTLSDPLSFRFKMANKVNNIHKLLDEICKEAKDIGLKPAEQLKSASNEHRAFTPTLPFVDDTLVVGRDDDELKVVDMLLGTDVQGILPVIAIVGMPGLGKTTLAQVVYKEAKVLNNFSERMWICVSDDFNVARLLNEMVQSLAIDTPYTPNIEGVVRKLRQKLHGKKYLLVLDDIWNTNSNLWLDLRNSLIGIGGAKESKILFTTRSMDVVSTMQTSSSCTYQLKQLEEEDCWTMFRQRAFANRGPSETRTLEDIGRRMVAKCKGLPLAINALGSLLYLKQDKQGWESIENSEIWSCPENNIGILLVLRLSFDHLPSPSLKQCFAYCSIFPKDKLIEKDELILLWMAQGYLHPSSRSKLEMEDIGKEYFNTLLRNSLFQGVRFDDYNNITACQMHDLVHDLAIHVSQGSCLTLEANEVNNKSNVQHLSLFLRKEMELNISQENVEKLRTLFLSGDLPQNTKYFKRIRVLRLVKSRAEELPNAICESKHLRFLDLHECNFLKIPKTVSKLYNLITLKLPRYPQELPIDIHKLVSLRHFYLGDTAANRKLMPMKIGQLTSLITLPFFVVGEDNGHRIDELGSLSKLRGELKVYNLQNVKDKEDAKKAKLLEKSGVEELEFHWDKDLGESGHNHEDVLEGLEPHQNVKGLKLTNFRGSRLASWMKKDAHSLHNLVKIQLIECTLCEQVPSLGHLPNLAYLEMRDLHNLKSIGDEFYGPATTTVFPALIEIKLTSMDHLEEWSDVLLSPAAATRQMDFFPRLQKFEIQNCPKLITLPETAFKGATSLQKLGIRDCEELTNLPEGLLQPTLVFITIWACGKLRTLNPTDETDAAFNGSTSLEEWSDLLSSPVAATRPTEFFPRLQSLQIGKCPKLITLPAFKGATSLQKLEIEECEELTCLPEGLLQPSLVDIKIWKCGKLRMLNPTDGTESAFNGSTSLQRLQIEQCPELTCLPKGLLQPTLPDLRLNYCPELKLRTLNPTDETDAAFNGSTSLEEWSDLLSSPVAATRPTEFFPRLQSLQILKCPKLITLPVFKGATSLQTLEIEECEELTCLPEGLLQPSLVDIKIWKCGKLRMLNPTDGTEAAFNGSTSLQRLEILHCPELTCLPKGLLQPTLEDLNLDDCPKLKTPNPDALRSLTSLETMLIQSCPNWVSCWEEGLFCTTSLQSLDIGDFGEEYRYFPWPSTSAASPPWSHFTSLWSLDLWGWPEVKSLPDQLEHLPALCRLTIRDFSGLESLPEWLGKLPSLQLLSIFGCPLVEERCEKGIGEDWGKIAHIPALRIGLSDGVFINDEE